MSYTSNSRLLHYPKEFCGAIGAYGILLLVGLWMVGSALAGIGLVLAIISGFLENTALGLQIETFLDWVIFFLKTSQVVEQVFLAIVVIVGVTVLAGALSIILDYIDRVYGKIAYLYYKK